uniref:Uncharacterized protein n=1 Tax=Strongyloides venezuelensis TaxID=75913 RepID=A0A0K0FLQ4_STRVS
MYYYTIVFILSFYSFFCVFGQNINDPDYYPPQINPNTDPIRRYLRLWSGILRNVAGDSESNYNYQQNNIRDFQQNGYQQPSYNEYNQRPFENLLKTWKNRIEEINLTSKSFNDGIPLNQLRSNSNHENNDDQQNYLQSIPNIKSSNDKEIISEMLLHKLLPRNKGDMYAFTSTTLKIPTTTPENEIPSSTVKSKSHKKSNKKNSSKSTSDSPLPLDDSNIGKNYKAKVKIGPSEELEKTTIAPVTDTTTIETDIEGSGEELTNVEKEKITNNIIDSEEEEEEDDEEVEEVEGNEVNQKKIGDLDITTNLPKVTEELLNNSTISKKNDTTEVDEKKIDKKDKDDKENIEDEEYSEEENEVPETNVKNIKSIKNNTLENDNEEEYNEVEYSSEEEVSTTTQPTTTTTLLTTTKIKKNKNPNNLKNNKQVKKEKNNSMKNNKKNQINDKKKAKEVINEPYTIPEAEEEEDFLLPKHSYAAQIDSFPESETTSTTKATPSQAQSVYNFYTNANANSTPNNSNTVVPVNTMVDGILPLLIPLLASRTPYLQNMLDNLAYGAKTASDFTPIKNESLSPMFSDKKNNHEEEKHLLSPINKKVSDAINSIKSIDKRIALDYINSISPQQVSNTNNGKIQNYYKTKIPEKTSSYIPLRPTNL